MGFLSGTVWQGRRHKRCEFDPWVGKIPWSRTWQPTPILLPGESHAQRNLGGTVHRVAKRRTWLKCMDKLSEGAGNQSLLLVFWPGQNVWIAFHLLEVQEEEAGKGRVKL